MCNLEYLQNPPGAIAFFKRLIEEVEPDPEPVLKPSRVVINRHGEATSYREAKAKGLTPAIIFVRDDGWSLGAPTGLMDTAEALWKDRWVTVIWHDTILSYEAFRTGG